MFLFQGIVQIRFESGLSEILELSSRDTFTMAETTAYFEAYRHVLEGLQEMKDALPMARYLVECNPTIKPPQYLLSARGTGQMDLSSLLREDSRWDASAVTIINPQRWPPREETTLNESQVGLIREETTLNESKVGLISDWVVGKRLCYNLMSTRAIKICFNDSYYIHALRQSLSFFSACRIQPRMSSCAQERPYLLNPSSRFRRSSCSNVCWKMPIKHRQPNQQGQCTSQTFFSGKFETC